MQALSAFCGLYCLLLVPFSKANTLQRKFNAGMDNSACQYSSKSMVQKTGSNHIFQVNVQREPEGRGVLIMCGSGRLGNNLHSLIHGMHFAKQIHATRITLAEDVGQMSQILDMPNSSSFDISQTDDTRWAPIPQECDYAARNSENGENHWASGYSREYCVSPASEFHAIAVEMVRPMFKPELLACAEGSVEGENPDETLTIHLRGNDMWGVDERYSDDAADLDMGAIPNHWLWNHPPCSMYKKIITEEGFKHVVLVTSPDQRHPCIKWPWFQDRAREGAISFRVQSGTLLEDSCALLQAHNLVLSFSTFPEAMAVLSTRVKRIYSRVFFQEHSVMDGMGWEGTTVHQYDVPLDEHNYFDKYSNTMTSLIDWFQNYPDDNIKLNDSESVKQRTRYW